MLYCFPYQGVANLAAVCLEISYPTIASAPHSLINGLKNLFAIAAETEIEFKEAMKLKEFLKVIDYFKPLDSHLEKLGKSGERIISGKVGNLRGTILKLDR